MPWPRRFTARLWRLCMPVGSFKHRKSAHRLRRANTEGCALVLNIIKSAI
jgi:hypothetical protein